MESEKPKNDTIKLINQVFLRLQILENKLKNVEETNDSLARIMKNQHENIKTLNEFMCNVEKDFIDEYWMIDTVASKHRTE